TAKALQDAGLVVTDVADLTGYPAMLGHRVVTLHPTVHAGILADLDDASHVADLRTHKIAPIALVVVNLYPFSDNPSIELIDIGGPTLVRGAAKNHAHVAVVVRPSDYARVIAEIQSTSAVSVDTRRDLASIAFTEIAHYDIAIARWMAAQESGDESLPEHLLIGTQRVQELRYGENPHQSGARYRFDDATSWWDTAVQHGGKELSYLNLYDTEAAWRLVNQFASASCAIVKHANPCGVAVSTQGSIAQAYSLANACDPVSAFGGIVAVNRAVTSEMAEALAPVFTEVVVAPSFDADALEVLLAKKNLRVISASAPSARLLDIRSIDGGFLVQEADAVNLDRSTWKVVTKTQPTAAQWDDLAFAWQVCAVVSSNAIVFAKDQQAFGIGAGQQNRLDSARIAAERSAGRALGGVCASDAFFPFRDGLDATAAAGIKAVIQPGGSVRDEEVIAAADEHGIAMVFTSERHFKH
ncbi:MAG: bifunctional phosphoribosylaminoimidazolecarboxamide formyltransferase/IMP cyclohydrolase, partial [Actinobacteria bacterium]|nr:bifunctional phosphoribosylaminoimidazolecarboxamide formyltransferase/IMP cyclohydrolase [Actinomycetota bacterium]